MYDGNKYNFDLKKAAKKKLNMCTAGIKTSFLLF